MNTPSSSYSSSAPSSCCHSSQSPAASAPQQAHEQLWTDDSTASATARVLFPVYINGSIVDATPSTLPPSINTSSHYPDNARQRKLWLSGLIGLLSMAVLLAFLCAPRDEHTPRMLLHPLSALRQAPPQSADSIRYLTFGSSSTWGEGLEEPQQQAYPYLLSKSVHNVAARVGGLSLSAICTQSIVEGINDNQYSSSVKVYDVIVTEFQDNDAESVIHLATRLRQRFPSATLIFVRLWSPATDIIYQPAGDTASATGLLEWWKHQSKQQTTAEEPSSTDAHPISILGSFAFQSAVLNSDSQRWSFVDYSKQADLVEKAIQSVDGHLVALPHRPTTATTTSIPALLTNPGIMSFFQTNQPSLLSPKGHQILASIIQQLVDDQHILEQRPSEQRRQQLGSWGKGDSCHLWYATGDTSSVLRKRRRASLVDFSRESDGHKHALEISRKGGSVDVTNPFDEPRMLYLTYMTAAASGGGIVREYPRTKISLGGKPTLMIDPIYNHHQPNKKENNDHDDQEDHLTRTTAVGLVPPGRTVLRLDSLDATSTSRFRLVGLHFLDQGKVPIPFEFDLEPDAAHR